MKRRPFKDNQSGEALAVITPAAELARHENPATGYLALLKTKDARRVQLQALASVARLLRDDLPEPTDGDTAQSQHEAAVFSTPWHLIDNTTLQFVATRLSEMHTPKTANRKLAAVRGVLKQAWLNGLLSEEDYRRRTQVKDIQGSRLRKGRDIAGGEIKALFQSCADDLASPKANQVLASRDAAIIALLCGGGLRRAEVCSLTLENLNQAKGTVRVVGKNNTEREVPLPPGTLRALERWLLVRGPAEGALVCPVLKGARIVVRHLNSQTIWDSVARRAKQAGIARVAPHDFRRTFIGDVLDNGADLALAQRLVGHKDPKTTASYDRRPDEALRSAVNRLHVPFVE